MPRKANVSANPEQSRERIGEMMTGERAIAARRPRSSDPRMDSFSLNSSHVRYWPLADIGSCTAHVCF